MSEAGGPAAPSAPRRWLEDFAAGDVIDYGRCAVGREDVIDFASKYDPQPFHLSDEGGAANPIFGRMAASGWHSAAMTMRLMVDFWRANDTRSMGSPGIDSLRWLKPVFPGDTLHAVSEVLEVRVSTSKPDRGTLRMHTVVRNQDDAVVMEWTSVGFFATRPRG